MKTVLASIGTVLTALVASACCWIPALLGAGAAGSLGFSAALAPYRGVLLGLAALFLAVGFFTVYRSNGACCATEAARRKRRLNIAVMWAAAVLSIGSALYPSLASFSSVSAKPASSIIRSSRTVTLRLQGLDCESCTAPIKQKLESVPGVRGVKVDYPARIAEIGLGTPEPSLDALLLAVRDAGFTASIDPNSHRSK